MEPVCLVIGAGGGFSHGQHISNTEDGHDAPLSHLFGTLLQRWV